MTHVNTVIKNKKFYYTYEFSPNDFEIENMEIDTNVGKITVENLSYVRVYSQPKTTVESDVETDTLIINKATAIADGKLTDVTKYISGTGIHFTPLNIFIAE